MGRPVRTTTAFMAAADADGLVRLILKHFAEEEGFTFLAKLHADLKTLCVVDADSHLLFSGLQEFEFAEPHVEW